MVYVSFARALVCHTVQQLRGSFAVVPTAMLCNTQNYNVYILLCVCGLPFLQHSRLGSHQNGKHGSCFLHFELFHDCSEETVSLTPLTQL